jgi:UDPglucose--hexose-1-phosphate uridylyltransferase
MDFNRPHRRLNILTGEWVLVSPHRAKRPWLGQREKIAEPDLPLYDPDCYLCPHNSRVGGKYQNPDYSDTFVFDNDFAALLPKPKDDVASLNENLFQAIPDDGICKVICFSPRHDLTFPELEKEQAIKVIETWLKQTEELAQKDFINYVQVFENKGAIMGCSNPHPHSQIWATRLIPNEPAKELENQYAYYLKYGRTLLGDYLKDEINKSTRIITANASFTVLVPFWAVWPFETIVISNRPIGSLPELTSKEIIDLADIIQQLTIRYDNLFEVSFPYSMGFHQKPLDGKDYPEWHLHAHFYPPLLRSATVKKFMVGFEMLGMPQRDITAEIAAERLRSVSSVHYKKSKLD